jgi:hypothetical protein
MTVLRVTGFVLWTNIKLSGFVLWTNIKLSKLHLLFYSQEVLLLQVGASKGIKMKIWMKTIKNNHICYHQMLLHFRWQLFCVNKKTKLSTFENTWFPFKFTAFVLPSFRSPNANALQGIISYYFTKCVTSLIFAHCKNIDENSRLTYD